MVFEEYAAYYDIFYKNKDYKSEVLYIDNFIRQYCPGAKTILDLGCGTGRHDLLLAENGYSICGVDSSKSMLEVAEKNRREYLSENIDVSFHHEDIRNFRSNKNFDIVISLFHVMSYQVTNDDLEKAFETASRHLKDDGIFIFDCWYGPGVLKDPPRVSIKKLEKDHISITRIGEPIMNSIENRVDVQYTVHVIDKVANTVKEINECHSMRYLFQPEVESFLKTSNLELLAAKKFMGDTPPEDDDWNACFIARKGK